jgi:acetyl esterase
LVQQAALGLKPIDQCTPAEFRRMMLDGLAAPGESEQVEGVEDHTVEGPAGPIPLRIYRPNANGRLPALMYFHGGGWVAGNLETHDGLCRAISNSAACAVIAVDYRLAPEHKYPAPVEDCFAATSWVQKHATALNIDSQRMAVGGDSAGGNLAAVVALMARDRRQPAICLQVLLYPIIEYNFASPSYSSFADGYLLTRSAMQWFWQQYVSREADAKQIYAAPLQAKDFRGLPPALIVTAEFDVLCDEGEAYAKILTAAEVPTEHTRYNGMIHGFIPRLKLFDSARTAVAQIATALKRAFEQAG